MRAKEVMAKYGISRPTLCAWAKEGKIEYVKLPNGQYEYTDPNIPGIEVKAILPHEDQVEHVINIDPKINKKLNLLANMAEIELALLKFLKKINFMSSDYANQLQELLAEYYNIDKEGKQD